MTRLVSIAGILFLFDCCFSAHAQKADTIAIDTITTKILVKEMNCRSFIKEVYDYRRRSTPWLYKGKKPALLVLYANWCSPCRRMIPVVNKLAEEYEGKIKFFRINVDNEKDLAQYFKAAYIPLFVLIPLKEEPVKYSGAMTEEELRAKLQGLIGTPQ